MPHSAHSVRCKQPLQIDFANAVSLELDSFSGNQKSPPTEAQAGFSYDPGSRTDYLIQMVSHLSVAPFGAAHI